MKSIKCNIIKAGRGDVYGRPFAIGQIYTGPFDYVRQLVSCGYATVDDAAVFDDDSTPQNSEIAIVGKGRMVVEAELNEVTGGIEFFAQGEKVYPEVEHLHEDKGVMRWVLGDMTHSTTIAAAGNVSSYAVDMSHINYANGTLLVKVAGSGTVKATAYGSMDGITTPVSLGDVLTGMVAAPGSYILKLSALRPFPFLTFVFTETGGSATATANAVIYATDKETEVPLPRSNLYPYIIGDETFISTIAAGVAQRCAPLDMRHIDRANSQLVIEVTGSGTCKLSAEGSEKVQSVLHSLGDVKTGMTAGTYTVDLTDNALAYFPWLVFTVTETGGSAGIAARIGVKARVLSRVAEKPAVLILSTTFWTRTTNWTTDHDDATMESAAFLESLGYRVDIRAVTEADSRYADNLGAAYVAIVVPVAAMLGQEWTTGVGKVIGKVLKGYTPIPVFATGVSNTLPDVKATNTFGLATRTAPADKKILWNGATWWRNTPSYTLTQQAHMTSLEVLSTTADTGEAVMWRYKGANGWVYCSAAGVQYGLMHLPHLFSSAILSGHLPKPPKKMRSVIDLDDIPDTENGGGIVSTIGDLERVYAAMQRLSMPSAWGIQAHAMHKVNPALFDFVRKYSANKGGLIYPVNHDSSATWEAKDTKPVQDTWFRAGCATMAQYGIRSGWNADGLDMWGYMYFNNNSFNENTISLASPEYGLWSSTDNKTQKTGYGWKVARSYPAPSGLAVKPLGHNDYPLQNAQWHRGVLIVGSDGFDFAQDIDIDDGGTGLGKAVVNSEKFFKCAMRHLPYYAHGNQCFDHDGLKAPFTKWLEALAGNYEAGLSNVVEFVHGSMLADF